MKKIAFAAAVLAIAGTVFAFVPAKHARNLFQKTDLAVCEQAPATSFNTGTVVTLPDGYSGYYATSACNTATVPGYQPNAQ